ncbi:hypothetical protein J7T55_010972 [Diaporthe amygdali]|uniref:uncharacterized protein n=1 Tax=Phomopsis amygdali TaxID=1214568 RepID=UPI0022FE27F4|nr:uncharacterized protein J7T55_010972 [Diaporthe amygdali]KAJ0103955.1 hypothetical protein J7T55_010972 [Diaporthe amygdali]
MLARIVDEKIATALILEDDVDWDVRVRQQMARIVQQFQQDQSSLTEDWDVLWLGNVGERFPKDDERKIVFQDPTVPSRQNLSPGFNSVKAFPDQSRVIHPSDFPLCTYAYAVSYAGAQKVLYHGGVDRVVSNFDTDLANNCWLYMNCISITPPIFHFDRNKGMERDSDTDQAFVKHNQEPGSYKNIETSVRLLMKEKFGKQPREDRIWRDVNSHRLNVARAGGIFLATAGVSPTNTAPFSCPSPSSSSDADVPVATSVPGILTCRSIRSRNGGFKPPPPSTMMEGDRHSP